ncbi:hypothetical protein ANO14919_138530 [Xylariales sp. No.14919]|nr:hypothetical protein ANO14919_138530 [Xylariales sp. No.14919]
MAANPKPSVVEAPPTNEDKIVVTLSTRGPSSIPQRRLLLTRTSPVIPIGRSSKVPSKGFVPADDNAWFENPVMSRQHAEIIAKFDDNPPAVYIKDIDSFHGTYHMANNGYNKEQRLTPRELVKMTHGDVVRFGIDIFRSNQTYPPCSVELQMEDMTEKKPNNAPRRGFTVPDDVDDEEDEIPENEGDSIDTAFYTKPAPINAEPKDAVPANTRRPPLIDLTIDGDDLPPHNNLSISSATTGNFITSSDVIDLTSEPNCESDIELCIVDPGVPRPSGFDSSSPAPTSSESRLRLSTSASLVQTSDGRIVVPSLTVHSDDEDMWHKYHDDDMSDEDAESYLDMESASEVSLLSTEDSNDLSEEDDASNYGETLSDVGREYREIDNFDDPSEGEIDSNMSYLSAGLFSDDDSTSVDEEDDDEDENNDGEEKAGEEETTTTTEPSNDQPRPETPVSLSASFHQPSQCETATIDRLLYPPMLRESLLTHLSNQSYGRDPSPSDAALFKRHPLLETLPNDSRAQQLGEKSGKFEFFAAREKNRAALNEHHSPAPISAIRETLLVGEPSDVTHPDAVNNPPAVAISNGYRSPSPTLSCPQETTSVAQAVDACLVQCPSEGFDATCLKLANNNDQYSAWADSGDRFINNPAEDPPEPQMVRFQTADFDMTSAYKFQQSKLATAVQNVPKPRRLFIKDLLDREPKQCPVPNKPAFEDPEVTILNPVSTSVTSTPAKRSYEEAFNSTENDSQGHTQTTPFPEEKTPKIHFYRKPSPITGPLLKKPDVPLAQNNVTTWETTAEEGQEISAIVPAQPESSRPAKRMRLATVAVKVAACVALGGAATFSYLVNTAPVF